MTYARENALAIVIAVALMVLIYLVIRDDQPTPGFGPTPAAQQSSPDKYPGCSFDGDFTNDKPGACPDHK